EADPDPGRHRVVGAAQTDLPALDPHRYGRGAGPEQGHEQLLLPVAVKPGHTEDLPAVQGQGDIADRRSRGQMLDLEGRLSAIGMGVADGVALLDRPAG